MTRGEGFIMLLRLNPSISESSFKIAITSELISLHQPHVHWLMLDVPRNLNLTHAQ